MIKIPVNKKDIDTCLSTIVEFNGIKTYNKLECRNNWIGILGEMKFHQYLRAEGIEAEWQNFVKKGWEEPDFILNKGTGKEITIDIKTTYDTKMWFQKPVFDVYVFARLNADNEDLILVGFINGKRMQQLIDNRKAEVVEREGRTDFCLKVDQLTPIEQFHSWLNFQKALLEED